MADPSDEITLYLFNAGGEGRERYRQRWASDQKKGEEVWWGRKGGHKKMGTKTGEEVGCVMTGKGG